MDTINYLRPALAKLDAQTENIRDRKAMSMAPAVAEQLRDFCRQDDEFAQAVAQGGSFADCMASVARGIGNYISDLDAYKRAVQYYFPGADVSMQIRIRTNPYEDTAAPEAGAGIVLSFSDFF